MLEHRQKHGQDHLNYQKNKQMRLSLPVHFGMRPAAAMSVGSWYWKLEVESFARDEELIEDDANYSPDYRSYSIKVWGKAFQEPVPL